jgi:hypothetical protein
MKRTLGEAKTGTCGVCQANFQLARFDQKYCSTPCREEAKKSYLRADWMTRPDREKRNQERKERYYATRPETLAKWRKWRADNPELARQKDHERYERNKVKHNERVRAYKKAHPEVRRKEYENSKRRFPWKRPLANARSRSLKKGFSFDLTHEWCEQNWTGRCSLSNLPFSFGSQTHFPFSPSVDRIDSAKGYTQDNCRFVLFALNSFKGTGTDQQMLEIASALLSHQNCAPCKL